MATAGTIPEDRPAKFVRIDPAFGHAVLDYTTDINRKQRLILDQKKEGTLAPDSVYVHGAITAVANFQASNRTDKFGYLMRHPTANNQVGREVSEGGDPFGADGPHSDAWRLDYRPRRDAL